MLVREWHGITHQVTVLFALGSSGNELIPSKFSEQHYLD